MSGKYLAPLKRSAYSAMRPAADFLELHDPGQFLRVDAVVVEDRPVGIGKRDRLGPELEQLLDGVLGDVARAGDRGGLAAHAFAAGGEHLLGEVHGAVAGGLGPHQRSAVGERLSGEHSAEAVGQLLVLPEEEADLAPAHADVAGGDVAVGPDVAEQLAHERLAEAHHFVVALALRIEVRAPLGAAHGQRGQAVLEDLLEGEELQHAQGDRGMEAQPALVRADGAVHLDAVAAVDVDLAAIVDPGDAEHDDPLRLHHPLQDLRLAIGLVGLNDGEDRLDDFADRLMELRLAGVPGHHVGHELIHGGWDVADRLFQGLGW